MGDADDLFGAWEEPDDADRDDGILSDDPLGLRAINAMFEQEDPLGLAEPNTIPGKVADDNAYLIYMALVDENLPRIEGGRCVDETLVTLGGGD